MAAVLSASLLGLIAAGALVYWWASPPPAAVVESVPGMDGRTGQVAAASETIRLGSLFERLDGQPSPSPDAWPGFRGADFSNIAPVPGKLADTWGPNGPPVLWTIELGEGHAGAAVSQGRVYVMDYDEVQRADLLRCFALNDGREIWRRGYKVRVKRNHGMSRTVPAVAGNVVVSMGPRCHVMGVAADTGDFLWGLDLERDFGSKVPDWYTGQCPLIDRGVAVLAPCGTNVFMLGVDCASGRTLWSTAAPGKWLMSHSSVAPATIDGKRMYVYAAINGVAGVSAEDGDRGTLLWQTDAWKPAVIVPSPVVMPDGRIFLTAGYGAGSLVLQVQRGADGRFSVRTVKQFSPREGLASEQQTPVFLGGRLFAVLPKDAGPNRNQFVCADGEGTLLWTSGKETRFGMGPFMVVGDRFLILDDTAVLTLARATVDGFHPMAQARILEGQDAWAPFALAGTRLLLRSSRRMACVELGERSP
jgi:outer membrane protein assembly factor BamB